MSSHVYILSNKRRTVFYTGVSTDLVKRINQHKAGELPGFTKQYNVDELMYYEEFATIQEAIYREKVLKKFRREWKFQLISNMNPDWVDLAKDW